MKGCASRSTWTATSAVPTTRYISRFPTGDPEITLVPVNSPLAARRIFAGEIPPGRGMIYLSGGLGRDLPAVARGRPADRVTAYGHPRLPVRQIYPSGRWRLSAASRYRPLLSSRNREFPSRPTSSASVASTWRTCLTPRMTAMETSEIGRRPTMTSSRLRLEKCARAIREDLRGCCGRGLARGRRQG